MSNESGFLKKRAIEFWERASEDFQKARYNLSALDVEQAVQLWLKHLIFLKAGDFPKTHYLDELIGTVSEVYGRENILNFYKERVLEFKSLEDAYITSRYFPKEFSREEARKIMKLAEELFDLIQNETHEKFI